MTQIRNTVPCDCGLSLAGLQGWLGTKPFWMRIKRLLAWALIVSPVVQIAMGSTFMRGLFFDLGLLGAHAILSLMLFGMPRAIPAERWMLWLGIEPNGLTPRGQFLMSGWRMVPSLATWTAVAVGLPWQILVIATPLLLLSLLLPFAMLGHVVRASEYAFRRWGMTQDGDAWVAGFVVAGMFAFANTINLVR